MHFSITVALPTSTSCERRGDYSSCSWGDDRYIKYLQRNKKGPPPSPSLGLLAHFRHWIHYQAINFSDTFLQEHGMENSEKFQNGVQIVIRVQTRH